MRSKPFALLLSLLLLFSLLPPTSGPTQAQVVQERVSKLDGALHLLQQQTLQKRGQPAPEDIALAKTLDVDLTRPDVAVTVLIQVRDRRIGQLLLAGFAVQAQIGDVVTATVPVRRLNDLVALTDVVRVEASQRRALSLDRSILEVRADQVRERNPSGVYSGRAGRGSVVGVIDSGIDWKHPDFQTRLGRTRIKYLWDVFDDTFQRSGGTTGTAPPITNMDGTPRGTVYTEDQINAALTEIAGGGTPQVFSRDLDGHGSHVAGIAAGNGSGTGGGVPAGTFAGVAPEADLVIVQGLNPETEGFGDADVIAGLSFIDDRAASMAKPWVTNLSLGGHFGPHDGTSLMERAINNLVGPGKRGKAVVIAAGNEGNDPIHTGPRAFTYERPVLSPGTSDPRTRNPFVNFGAPGEPVLSGSFVAADPGAVVFRANFIAPPAPPNFDGIFVAVGDEVIPVVRNGDPAPLGGQFGRSFQRPPSINAQGDIAFDARFQTPGTGPNWGIFIASGALSPSATINVQRLVAQGQTAPGFTPASGNRLFFGFDPAAGILNVNPAFSLSRLNDRRQVAFTAQIQDPAGGLTLAIFIASPTDRALLAMVGAAAAGTGGGTFAAFRRPVSLNNNDTVAFVATIRGGRGGEGIFTVNAPGTPSPVVLTGDVAPGTNGGTFSALGAPTINDQGAIVFIGGVTGSGSVPPVTQGVFLVPPSGPPVPIALSGDPSPDPPARTTCADARRRGTFAEFLGIPAINNAGFISFLARLDRATAQQGIFLVLPDDPSPRTVPVALGGGVRVGTSLIVPPAPGTTGGEDFAQFSSPVMSPMSSTAALAFGARLQDGTATDGIFVASLAPGRLTPGKPPVIQAYNDPCHSAATFDFWFNRQDDFTMTIYGGGPARTPPFSLTTMGVGTLDATSGIVVNDGDNVNGDREVSFVTVREGHFIMTLTPTIIRSEGRVDGWIPSGNAEFVGLSDDRTRLVGMPGTAAEAITVGAHVSKTAYVDSTGTEQEFDFEIGSLALFSSPGPTRDARQKPEITAPGILIGSTRSRDAMGRSNDPSFILPDGMHYINFGTSQAAPHVTGAIAILLEKNPRLDAPQIKQILMSAARQDTFTDALPQPLPGPIPDPDDRRPEIFWGAGKLDVLAAFNATPPGILGVDPTDLNFMATLGGPNPPIQRVAVVKAGGGTEIWATSSDAPWIRVSPEAGLAPSVVEVMVDVRNLPAGVHTGHITFVPAAPGVVGSTLTVTLTLSSP